MVIKKHISLSFSRLAVIASIAVFVFYLTGNVLLGNIYEFAVVGAVFEILSLPMLALLALLIIYHLVLLTRRYKASSKLTIISLAFTLATLAVLVSGQL